MDKVRQRKKFTGLRNILRIFIYSKLQFIAICAALGPTASALHLSLQPFKLYFLVVFSAGRPLGYFMDYLIWNEVWLGPGDEAGARLDLRSHARGHEAAPGYHWMFMRL